MATSNLFMSEDDCKALAGVAFTETDQAKKVLGKAVQRMAAAIMAHHSNLVANASKASPIISLTKPCDPREMSARRTLQDAMVGFFMPNRITVNTDLSDKDTETKDREKEHSRLIRDGLELASILALCNVELSAYDPAKGLWNVPILLFCEDGYSVETDVTTVTMDGTAWVSRKMLAGGKPDYKSWMASVARLKAMRKPKIERPDATNAGQGDTGNKTESVTIRSKIAELMKDLRATDNGKVLIQTWANIEEPDRNAIYAFRKWCDALDAATAAATSKPARKAA